MLKSINFIRKIKELLESSKNSKIISKYFIELKLNHSINIHIVSDEVTSIEYIVGNDSEIDPQPNNKVSYFFYKGSELINEDINSIFSGEEISLEPRRSLSTLFENNISAQSKKQNVITFYSYKGGVGRTTSLALTALYLSKKGKNVFILDCDFEAPGIINFFNTSQTDVSKNGIVEYLNDIQFDKTVNISDYIVNVDKEYSGIGNINFMPAGNILSTNPVDSIDYLEGLSRIDFHGLSLVRTFSELISTIQKLYSPDIIIVDSRTGFNNIFGVLIEISKHIVILSGDDIQNQPGLLYSMDRLKKSGVDASFVLSIVSSNYSRRFNNFEQHVLDNYSNEADVFYFDRQLALEFIGTSLEDKYDLEDFISGESGSSQYHKFFNHILNLLNVDVSLESDIEDTTSNNSLLNNHSEITSDEEIETDYYNEINNTTDIREEILNVVEKTLPDLYAENIDYTDEYIEKALFIRPCMEDFFIPEKTLLLGDKGTGKTAFYQALSNAKFFRKLEDRSQKKHLNYSVFNVTNFEVDNFEVLGFDDYQKDELFIKKFWIFIIWNALSGRGSYKTELSQYNVDLSKSKARDEIISIIQNPSIHEKIEDELNSFNSSLKREDKRLIITFDKLDNIVKPYMWNNIITPLVKLCIRFPYGNIFPKLFMRRDLYDRLGNLTNKSSFDSRTISLEWSQNEMFSYFLKIVFSGCKELFFEYLSGKSGMSESFISNIRSKLKTKSVEHNQLPLDTHLIKPIINIFFGAPKPKRNGLKSTAYADLYRNIQSADKTVNLRPFLDLLTYAIKEQREQDASKNFRKEAILGIAYCTSRQVRKSAVINYLRDLWTEEGNEFVKCFCEHYSKNKVDSKYKTNSLHEFAFENLLSEIKKLNEDIETIKQSTVEDLKNILIANKIVTPYLVGNKTRYSFAYLYTNYLGV